MFFRIPRNLRRYKRLVRKTTRDNSWALFDFSDGQSDGVGALFRRRGLYRIWSSEKSDCVAAVGTSTTRVRTAPIQTQNRRLSQAYKSYKRSGFISSRPFQPLGLASRPARKSF